MSFFILFPGSPSAELGTGSEKIEATKKDRAGISSISLGRDYSPCCLRFGARSQQWVFEALSEDIVRYGELFFVGIRYGRIEWMGARRQAGERLRYQRVYKCPDIMARLRSRS